MIYSFINQKGGVGKTTSCVNTSAFLASKGYKVLIIDLDSQANASNALGIHVNHNTVYELLIGKADVLRDNVIRDTDIASLKIIPSCTSLAGAEIELCSVEKGRELILKQALEAIKDDFDYIMRDCPPSLGLLTVNALSASDALMIPLQCEYLSMLGLSQLMYTLRQVQKYLNPNIRIEGIILTMYDKRSNLTLSVRREIEEYFKDKVFKTTIPRNVRLAEAPSFGLPIVKYDMKSSGAKAYNALVEEFIARSKSAS